ncbi:LOW QUALITY PROTEIN: hypothetical protein HJC23_006394 [Cyclotella cryptica]|uniref:Uncharacterized protein n=1 Tax=Cyclotella cryptica TaxID=29204 RepID=A0ABD3Q430_9STRA
MNSAQTHCHGRAYVDDPETALIRQMIEHPHTINKESLSKLHYVYHGLICRSQIVITANGMLALHEPIKSTDDSISLQLVPRLSLQSHWRKLQYDLVHKCGACQLSNATLCKSSELVYNFPTTAPTSGMHIDCYTAGHIRKFNNVTCYIVGACNMTAFGLLEGIMEPNSSTFAAADSKFHATFRDIAWLLKLNTHTLSCVNHDPMLVKCIGRYLNKSLKIFNSEHNYSTGSHLELITCPKLVNGFARRQAIILEASHKIGRILIDRHHTYYHEFLNSLRPDSKLFEPGDYVFAWRMVQSSAKHIRGNLNLPVLALGSFSAGSKAPVTSVNTRSLRRLINFMLLISVPFHQNLFHLPLSNGPDHRFCQIHRPLRDDAYKAAGLEGFLPYKPFQPFHKVRFADDHILSEPDIDTLINNVHPFSPSHTISFVATPPSSSQLAVSIINSTSSLFFISWHLPSIPHCEWHLVCVDLPSSLSFNPHCLTDGCYLDKLQHPRNQRWWLEYHAASTVACLYQGDYRILRPDSYAPIYVKELNLHPHCQWVNLLNHGTYVHGPFKFATINGRKTHDRISLSNWEILSQSSDQYDNDPPDLDHRYFTSIQFLHSYHTVISDPTVHDCFMATHFLLPELPFPVPHGL